MRNLLSIAMGFFLMAFIAAPAVADEPPGVTNPVPQASTCQFEQPIDWLSNGYTNGVPNTRGQLRSLIEEAILKRDDVATKEQAIALFLTQSRGRLNQHACASFANQLTPAMVREVVGVDWQPDVQRQSAEPEPDPGTTPPSDDAPGVARQPGAGGTQVAAGAIEMQRQLDGLTNEVARLRREQAEMRQQRDRAQADLPAAEARLRQADEALTSVTADQSAGAKWQAAERQVRELKQTVEASDRKITGIERSIKTMQGQISSLQNRFDPTHGSFFGNDPAIVSAFRSALLEPFETADGETDQIATRSYVDESLENLANTLAVQRQADRCEQGIDAGDVCQTQNGQQEEAVPSYGLLSDIGHFILDYLGWILLGIAAFLLLIWPGWVRKLFSSDDVDLQPEAEPAPGAGDDINWEPFNVEENGPNPNPGNEPGDEGNR